MVAAAAPLAMWGAFDGLRMIGTASLDDYHGLPVVCRVALSRPYRRQGVGRRILAVLEEEARRRGFAELWATARARFLRRDGVLGGRRRP